MTKRATTTVLPTVAILLLSSGVLRILVGADTALANTTNEASTVEQMTPVLEGSETSTLLAGFQARETRLATREAKLADRLRALSVVEQQVAEQLVALEGAEAKLSATISQAETASQIDLQRLATVYENMPAKDAAALFEEMPAGFAAGFLGMMEPLASAKIMAALPPDKAYSFSVVLAGRNANTPTE